MTDRRPDRVYGVLVREGTVFLRSSAGEAGLPGGVFRPMAEDRKVELRAHLRDQLGIDATNVWAQGGFDYTAPGEDRPHFSGFYSVWAWEGDIPEHAGTWVTREALAGVAGLPGPLRILLLSVLDTVAMRTT